MCGRMGRRKEEGGVWVGCMYVTGSVAFASLLSFANG